MINEATFKGQQIFQIINLYSHYKRYSKFKSNFFHFQCFNGLKFYTKMFIFNNKFVFNIFNSTDIVKFVILITMIRNNFIFSSKFIFKLQLAS